VGRRRIKRRDCDGRGGSQHQPAPIPEESRHHGAARNRKAVREGIASGKLKGHEALPAKATFNIEGVNLKFEVNGDVELT
jgi:hypothetical protein